MKLNDTYLCPDCDEVFSYKDQHYFITNHHPICPICGNKNVLNLGRVLNRKEGKDEIPTKHNIVHGYRDPDSQSIVNNSSCGISASENKPIETGGNQDRTGRSGGENLGCGVSGKSTNGLVRATSTLVDVFGKLFQATSGIKKVLSGTHADSSKQGTDAPG